MADRLRAGTSGRAVAGEGGGPCGSNTGQMSENGPDKTPVEMDPTNPVKKKGRLRTLYDDANEDIAAQIKPGGGVVGEKALKAQRALQVPMIIAAALTLPSLILLETQETGLLAVISVVLNWGTWLAFLIELIVMLAVVPNRWRYIKGHPVEIAIVVLTPPILPAGFQFLRVFRLFRLLRLLKLAELSRTAFSTRGLGYAALMTLMVALAGGTLFRSVEAKNQDLTEWESIYWAMTTMMTLGSQYQPTTTISQVVELGLLIAGVGFISILTGALAHRFIIPPSKGSAVASDSGSEAKQKAG